MYWSDHETRPYIRAMIYKAQALSRKQEYGETLVLCDRLERECGQDITAAMERAPIYLNSGLWQPAIEAARYVHDLYPAQSFALAFGHFEEGDPREALVRFLAGTLRFPRTARMLTGVRLDGQPDTPEEVRDHNEGVDLVRDLRPYLSGPGRDARRFFERIVVFPDVVALVDEAEKTRRRWRAERGEDGSGYRKMMEIESLEFARKQAEKLLHLARVEPRARAQ